MKRLRLFTPLLLALVVAACNGNEPVGGVDGSIDTGPSVDGAPFDDSSSDATEAGSSDGGVDAGPLYPPALWSRAADHVGYSILLGETAPSGLNLACLASSQGILRTWVGEGESGYDLGTGPQSMRATFRYRMGKDGKACDTPTILVLKTDTLTTQGGRLLDAQDVTDGILVSRADFSAIVRDNGLPPSGVGCSNGVPRAHAVTYLTRTTVALDSCPSNSINIYGPNSVPAYGMGIQDTNASRAYPSPAAAPTVAVDALEPSIVFADDMFAVGRLAGPTFDFDINTPQVGDVSGSGFFLLTVKRNAPLFDFDSVTLLGGTPLSKPGPVEEPGTGGRVRNGVVTLSFEGTLTVGNKTLTSPSNAPATAVIIFKSVSNKYSLVAAFAFGKGAAAKGKPNRPRAIRTAPNTYVLADTVWDTLDVNGTVLTAKQGADVALVTFDESGKVLASRTYGGPGNDESYELTANPSLTSVFWTGHSTSSIDFGNGPLVTSAPDGEGWATELVP